jgi:uncharacterized protein with ParB-like and HNH nuclease domain
MSAVVPHYRTVQQLLQNQSFSIDEYQREYKWEKRNIDELISDLMAKFSACYVAGHETSKVAGYAEYFLGSIIVSKRNGKNYLIDGQQRVTSLTLLLIHLIRLAKDRGNQNLVSRLSPLIYSDNWGQPQFNLDIPERLSVLKALYEGIEFATDGCEESVKTMHERYKDIEQQQLGTELGDSFPHFVYWLMEKVGLIEIATDNDGYAYAIFETMNDRGKPLSPVDMLKAYLLAPLISQDKLRHANTTWKTQVQKLITLDEKDKVADAQCIKAWLRAQYAETIRDRKADSIDKDWELIGTVFHRWVRDNSNQLKLGTESANNDWMTVNFPFFASAYYQILEASRTYTPGLESIYYNAHNDFTWQTTVLLAPLNPSDSQDVVTKKMAVTATYLDIWLIRRVTNYFKVSYSNVSYSVFLLCKEIRRKNLNELVDIFTLKLEQDEVTFSKSPVKGRSGLETLGLNQFSRRYLYHMLARMAAFTENGCGRGDHFPDFVDRDRKNPFDIEHIWPDDYDRFRETFESEMVFQDWRNQIASLLLLPQAVNRSLQDKPYGEKVPVYLTENIYAASLAEGIYNHQPQFETFRNKYDLPFKPFTTFGKQEQLERRKLVQKLVELIWSPERLKEAAQ